MFLYNQSLLDMTSLIQCSRSEKISVSGSTKLKTRCWSIVIQPSHASMKTLPECSWVISLFLWLFLLLSQKIISKFIYLSSFKIYFWENKHEPGKGRKRGDQRIQNGLHADGSEPNTGLQPANSKIMTLAEVNAQLTEPPRAPREFLSFIIHCIV